MAAYLKWGISCIDRFQGMFAIALYDRETKELFLVRDRIGKKPLYYWYENENLVFASELKPIMAHPNFKKTIRRDVIKRYMYQQCVNEPDSIFENVYKVEPGQIVKFDVKASQKLSKWKYWDIATVYHEMKSKPVGSYEEAKTELKDILRDSVKKRMISDVPLGAFLSGGYDSSLVTAIAQEASSEPVKTYSIGFNEEKYNEAKYAKEVANHLGTKHTELYIDEEAMFKMVDSIPKYYDEPFADSSQIPTMLVSELASKDVTVVLSGDGGDEFFCGYNIYDNVAQAQKLDFLGRMTYGVCNIPPFKQMGLLEKLPFRVQVVAGNNNPLTKTQIGGATYISAINKMLPESGIPFKFPIEDKYNESNWQERRMLLDEDTYLPGDILCKVDRASMKYSIESRCPILDVNVMEYSYRLPHDYKYSGGVKKRILKDIAYDYIPKSLLDRPKVGFSVPLDKWMRGALKEQLIDLCNSNYIKRQGIFDAEYINEFIADYMKKGDGGSGTGSNYSRLIWSYFVFQQWYNFYI